MGVVYEALDEQIGRRVAIKRLHGEYSRQPDIVQRFFNEARAVNLISHPAIVQVSELATAADGSAYLVMEYLAGSTLSQRLSKNRGTLSEPATLRIISQLASALAAAHEVGITHRDLKPSNVMLIPDPAMPEGERVKLLDFGIAKLGQGSKAEPLRTRTGLIMGTPAYMAPEQCLGAAQVDGKADVYSLGIMTYELLVGRPPFVAEHDLVCLQHHLATPAPSVRKGAPAASRAIESLIERMLRKDAASRPSMAAILAETKRMMGEPSQPPSLSTDASTVHSLVLPGGHHPSTLRHSIGQLAVARRPGKRLSVGLLVIGGLILASGLTYRLRQQAEERRHLATRPVEVGTATPSPSSPPRTRGVGAPAGPAAVAAAPKRTHIRVHSEPKGAQVIHADTAEVVGTTPWQMDVISQKGELKLILRKPGYQDRLISVSQTEDSDINEMLVAVETKKAASPPRSAGRVNQVTERSSSGGKPAAKPTLQQNTYDQQKIAD